MRTFIIRSALFFLFAVLVSVGVFFLIYWYQSTTTSSLESLKETAGGVVDTAQTKAQSAGETLSEKIPAEGIPLSSVPLSETQKKTLSAVNVDAETFVITPSMVECGTEKIGKERVEAIVGGSAPTLIEITKLSPCLAQ